METEAGTHRGPRQREARRGRRPDLGAETRRLFDRLRARDDGAAEAWVRRFGPRLLALARCIAPGETVARDAVRDAFLAAFRHVERFHGGADLCDWLDRALVRRCLGARSGTADRDEAAIDALLPRFDATGHHALAVRPWPAEAEDREVPGAETVAVTTACIDGLPAALRAVLALHDRVGWSTEEVSDVLGVAPSEVRLRLHHARQALRAALDPFLGGRAASPPLH